MTPTNPIPLLEIDDWQQRLDRQDAFWHCELLDRPVACMSIGKQSPGGNHPAAKTYASERQRWFDAEAIAQQQLYHVRNTEYLGDALPHVMPNLGPEVFSAFFGTELEYGPATSWSIANLEDWAHADKLQFDRANAYWRQINAMTDIFLEIGRGYFYTGITDLHPGGDAIAAFRDPLNLNIDMIENVEPVKALLERVTDVFVEVYNSFADKLQAAGQPISTWAGIVSRQRWYVPSNDFSCMISKAMFDDIFLAGIRRECQSLEASIYHLDGPQALQHLDSLLEIPELNAIQWVYGAGNGRASDWLHVYRKCQAAGKAIQLGIDISELETIIAELSPKGVWLSIGGIGDRHTGNAVLKRLCQWR